ncbi:GIY-YIG nuclease family protein, partial [Nostoc sp. NIES-2111]
EKLLKFAFEFKKLVLKESPLIDSPSSNFVLPQIRALSCSVYVMLNTRNGLYKIGASNNASFREKTLQAEDPSVIKIKEKAFSSRELAFSQENALHKIFKLKRTRGEWFQLEQEDLHKIDELLG